MSLQAEHTWIGDLTAVLRAPSGEMHTIFDRVDNGGINGCFGDSSNLGNGNTYTFSDTAAAPNDWWAEAQNGLSTYVMAGGDYKASNNTGAQTVITDSFAGISNPNGTWVLSITDANQVDTGSVNSATLTFGTLEPRAPNVDMDGDGISDFAVVRDGSITLRDGGNTSLLQARSMRERLKMQREMKRRSSENLGAEPPVGSSIIWYINNSDSGSDEVVGFGEAATDFVVPDDYDGDGQDDIAVFRPLTQGNPSGNGYFYIMNSGNSTVDVIDFGQGGDNPSVVGDYDGDGQADPAVFRCPPTDGQCFFFYRGSAGGGEITYTPWGFGSEFTIFPNPGDFDGDGQFDFCVQRTATGFGEAQGQFVLLRSSDMGVEYINWGFDTDWIAPGDYDGDGRSDYAVVRDSGTNAMWYVLSADGATVIYYGVPFGLSPVALTGGVLISDYLTPGDYDGDGATDIAIFRPDADPNNNYWYYLRSSDLTVGEYEYGQFEDYPVENWRVN